MLRRLVFASLAASAAALATAAPALAHIHADPGEAQAGSEQTIGFTIEHGCDGSPTIAVEILVPDGATGAAPEAIDGWTSRVDVLDEDQSADVEAGDEVVVFDDGSLADGTEGTFEVTMTLPPTADTTIYFPIVQRCEVGELRWIEIPVDGEEPDSPAPAMDLVGPVVTTPPSPTTPEATTPAAPATTPDAATATTEPAGAPDTVPTTLDDAPATSLADVSNDDEDSGAGTTVFIISVIAVLIVAALAFTVARRNRASDGTTPADDEG